MLLDAIRLKRVTRGELAFYKARANRDYAEAFQQAGMGTIQDQPARVAVLINGSAVRWALLAAVYDWSVCAAGKEQRGWLMAVARLADPSSDSWYERVLDPPAWDDPTALAELARAVPANQSVSLLLALGERLRSTGGDAVPFLKRVQMQYPADFWANLILGNAMLQRAPLEAGGYYRAALSSRPVAAVGYCAVGDALRLQGAMVEATDYYRKALQLDPGYARAHSNLGEALQAQGHVDEAIDANRQALQFDPDYAWAHNNLGNALRAKGRLDEAYDHYQQVIRLDPKNPWVQVGLRQVGMQLSRGEEVWLVWKDMLDANPPEPDAWDGYAELSLFLGHEDDYRRIRLAAIDRFATSTDPFVAERTGRACLLLPASEAELRTAVRLIEFALSADPSKFAWARPYFLFARGLAEYRQGRLESAISLMGGPASGVLGPAPSLVLAMARQRLGQKEVALRTFVAAILGFDWRMQHADVRDAWIYHVLRREAEAMIMPDLPEFLQGKYQPRNNDERLALLGICQFKGLWSSAARLYADSFAADPKLGEDRNTRIRYSAACLASLAASVGTENGIETGNSERTHWRIQARDWLRADLAALANQTISDNPASRELVQRTLESWQVEPDLAGLREPSALEKLSADERQECLAFWKEVAALLNRARKAD